MGHHNGRISSRFYHQITVFVMYDRYYSNVGSISGIRTTTFTFVQTFVPNPFPTLLQGVTNYPLINLRPRHFRNQGKEACSRNVNVGDTHPLFEQTCANLDYKFKDTAYKKQKNCKVRVWLLRKLKNKKEKDPDKIRGTTQEKGILC